MKNLVNRNLRLKTFFASLCVTAALTVHAGSVDNAFRTFAETKKGTVAFLGGSITEMGTIGKADGYRPLLIADLERRFPETVFRFTSAGIGSTCSDTGAFRFQADVLDKGVPDLLFVEYAVNDDQDGHKTFDETVRALEGIVRRAWTANPKMDIVFSLMANREMLELVRRGETPVPFAAHRAVAARYGIPVADVCGALAESEARGGFGWKEYGDCHPTPAGCAFAFGVQKRILDASCGAARGEPAPCPAHVLGTPLDASNYGGARWLDFGFAHCDDGWHKGILSTNVFGSSSFRPRFYREPILWSTNVGAVCTVDFTGTTLAAFLTSGPDAGNLDVSVDGGAYVTIDLWSRHSDWFHYPFTKVLADKLATGRHVARLRVSKEANAVSKGHAVRILHLGVSSPDPRSDDLAFESRIAFADIDLYSYNNLKAVKEPIRGIVIDHHGLGCNIFGSPKDFEKMTAEDAAHGIVWIHPHYGPWAWMNDHAVRLTDRLVDLVLAQHDLPKDLPVCSSGGSMGGQGAYVYARYSRHNVRRVVVNCGVADLAYHYTERPDLPRTITAAFADAPDFEAELKARSPLALARAGQMPRIDYVIFHSTNDNAVSIGRHAEPMVAALKAAGNKVEYHVSEGTGHTELRPELVKRYYAAIREAFGERDDK